MKYNFSVHFLKIIPPYTSFGDTWDAFCLSLLQQEHGHKKYLPLNAPDNGIDILNRSDNVAIQCKSIEQGSSGTIPVSNSLESLRKALEYRDSLGWSKYTFATNANHSGKGIEKILAEAVKHHLGHDDIDFQGPEYWSRLCEKHIESVKHFLDYRLLHTEAEVERAFRKANYYEKHVNSNLDLIRNDNTTVEIKNNKTPLVLKIPFSKELTVKHCLDVVTASMGLNLDSEHYSDLNSTVRPRFSIVIGNKRQPLNKKIGAFSDAERSSLMLHIQAVYSQKERQPNMDYLSEFIVDYPSKTDMRKQALDRFNLSIENKMWDSMDYLSMAA